jgi:hypothetical protein
MTKKMALGIALVAAGAIAVAACTQRVERVTPTLQPAATPAQAPPPTPTPRPVTPTPSAPPATPTPTSRTAPVSTTPQFFGLFLEIEGLADENVVRGDTVVARGRTSPAAVLSINGVIVPVDGGGNFQVQLALDPGPNIIEVVASDLNGNEISRVIAVVSLPEGV